jgi:glycosyltransferase involved in cell wall biosynthesis
VAFAGGGALEIIEDGLTGFLFAEQTVESVAEAMQRSLDSSLAVADLRASALRFGPERFFERFEAAIEEQTASLLSPCAATVGGSA